MGILSGKTAVITGGTRGLGLGIAQAFSQAGAAVVLSSRSQAAVDEAVQLIRSAGGKADGIAADVGCLEDVEACARLAAGTFGGIDIWVNNAGTAGPYGPTVLLSPADFTQVVQTNILGVYHGSLTAMHYFLPQRSGKLINLLGHGYKGPVTWQNAYSASKGWVLSFTKALAQETKDSGAGVFAFNPGMVLTDLLLNVDVIEGSEARLAIFPTIVRMWAKPVHIPAQKAVWIASSATDGQTGRVISMLSSQTIIGGAVAEGWRRLTRKSVPDLPMQIRVKPAHRK
jgi:glucose 1-dehydrogenase